MDASSKPAGGRKNPPRATTSHGSSWARKAPSESSPASGCVCTEPPEAISSAVCPFDTLAGAVDTVIRTIQFGIPVARIELLDEVQMDAINRYSGYDYPLSPTLFFEFHGSEDGVREQVETTKELAAGKTGAGSFDGPTARKSAQDSGKRAMTPTMHRLPCAPDPRVGPRMSACRYQGSPNASWRPDPISTLPG